MQKLKARIRRHTILLDAVGQTLTAVLMVEPRSVEADDPSRRLVCLQYRGPVEDDHGLTAITEALLSLRDGDEVEVKVLQKDVPSVGPTRHVRKILAITRIGWSD